MRQKNVSLCPIHSAAKYEELIYISQAAEREREAEREAVVVSGKVEKCDSYKRNMRGDVIYVPPRSLDVK